MLSEMQSPANKSIDLLSKSRQGCSPVRLNTLSGHAQTEAWENKYVAHVLTVCPFI